MNRICWMIVFYLVMGTSILNAQTLIPEQNGKGKWGYVDLDGKKVIDYKFKEAYPFIDGKAKVKKGEKWGYIDARGKEVIKIKYSEMYEWNGDYCKIAEGGSVKDGILTGAK
ncbi:WG repeat-containing protein [Bacteroides congonensis]|nr:WG repeat-containing protein [Bacteroides congonensis]